MKNLVLKRAIAACLAGTLILTSTSVRADSCPAYRPYAEAAVVGGAIGTAGGIVATAVISGAVITTTATATGTTLGVAIATDCLTTGCLVTIAVGLAAGIVAALVWIFGTSPRDCAGALVFEDTGKWWSFRNHDTLGGLRDAMERRYGEELTPVKIWAPFRHCAAAVEGKRDVYLAEGRTIIEARNKALRACRDDETKGCRLAVSQCNG